MPNENHKPDKPLTFGCNYELGPLPETNYVLGHPGDGYSQDRCSTWPAWDDDQVKAYTLREVQKAVAAERERRIPDVDELAQHIRWLNGSNKMGAGSLAEKLVEWMRSRA